MEVVFICDHQSCGRSFPNAGALNCHRRSCLPGRKRLQSALAKGKELWEAKKRARTAAANLAKEALSSVQTAPINRLLQNADSPNAQSVRKTLVHG